MGAATAVPIAAPVGDLDTWNLVSVPLPSNDVAYDGNRDVLLVTVPASHTSLGNELVELDPETGALGRHVWVGSQPGRVVVSDDGTTAHVALRGASSVARVDLDTFSVVASIPTPIDPDGGPTVVEDLEAVPGRDDAVVASLRVLNSDPVHAGVVLLGDEGAAEDAVDGPSRLATTGPGTLFGYDESGHGHFSLTVDDDGVTGGPGVAGPLTGSGFDVEAASGRVYASNGKILDAETYEVLATVPHEGPLEVTDDGRLTVVHDSSFLVVYDAETGSTIDSRTMLGIPAAQTLVASGTGFALAGGTVVSLLGPSVSGPQFTAPPAPDSELDELRRTSFPYRVNDLEFDAERDLLYASIRTGSEQRADELIALDPDTGAVLHGLPLGNDPGPIALSPDGSLLHVGLNTTGRIATVDLESFSSLGSFALGSDAQSTFHAADIEVRPGTTDELLVSLAGSVAPEHRGVALFVDGVRRPSATAGPTGATRIEAVDGSTVYGVDASTPERGLYRQAVSDGGVEAVQLTRSMFEGSPTDFELHDGLIYSWGRVIDPVAPALVGVLPMSGPVAVDPIEPRIYVAKRVGGIELLEVDRETLRTTRVSNKGTFSLPLELVSTRTETSGLRLAMSARVDATRGELVLFTQNPGRLHPVAPARVVDTRSGLGAPVGRVAAGNVLQVDVSGVGGVPDSGASAVVVNLTVVGATSSSHLTAWPTGEPRPGISNLNFRPGQVVANQAIVRVGPGGTISIANHTGAVHVIVDVQGWFSDGTAPSGSRFNPVAPARLADTRTGVGLPSGRIPGGTTRHLEVTGVGGVPASGVSAVVVNLTAVGATASTHLTAWATGSPRPTSSNVNVVVGQVVANQAIVPVSPDGRISIANHAGATHLVVDVQGWFGEDGLLLRTSTAGRIADSRPGGINIGPERIGSGGTVVLAPVNVLSGPPTTAAVVLNITAVGAVAPGYLTAWAYGQPKPATSNVNFGTGQVVANQAFVPVGGLNHYVNLASANGATHVVVDVLGWFVPYV